MDSNSPCKALLFPRDPNLAQKPLYLVGTVFKVVLPFHSYFLFLAENNTTLSPGFLCQWFNNLQQAALLMSLVQRDKVLSQFGQQQLVMVNYVCGFNQSETGKYFE